MCELWSAKSTQGLIWGLQQSPGSGKSDTWPFRDCNRALVLGRGIPDHADFVRTTKVAYARCFGFTVRHVLFVAGKTGKPDALQNKGFYFFVVVVARIHRKRAAEHTDANTHISHSLRQSWDSIPRELRYPVGLAADHTWCSLQLLSPQECSLGYWVSIIIQTDICSIFFFITIMTSWGHKQ